jgi:hypothetical protein
MYVVGTTFLVSDGDHLNISPATYKNASSASESSGVITIDRTNSGGNNDDWVHYYITGLVDTVDPTNSYILSSVPYFPSYAPNAYKYEVCVF